MILAPAFEEPPADYITDPKKNSLASFAAIERILRGIACRIEAPCPEPVPIAAVNRA